MIGRIQDRRILAYGFSPQADIRAVDVTASAEGMEFSLVARDRPSGEVSVIQDLMLPMPGKHNVLNSLAAIAVGLELGIPEESIRKALAGFGGVKRRFTKTGSTNGVTVIDDYGHHPVEISAVLAAAREKIEKAGKGRIIAVMQPHRYTRLHDLFEAFCSCFNDADHVIIADVYAAGEVPIAGADRDALVEGLRARGHRHAIGLEDPDKLAEVIAPLTRPGDLVICLGAGNITAWAHELPERLAEVMGDDKDATGGEA
jgi:UDP-N-acetylmuramate--alanine ligase